MKFQPRLYCVWCDTKTIGQSPPCLCAWCGAFLSGYVGPHETWQDIADRAGRPVPAGVKPEDPVRWDQEAIHERMRLLENASMELLA